MPGDYTIQAPIANLRFFLAKIRKPDYEFRHECSNKRAGKPQEYALISHDKIVRNMTVEGLVALKVQ